MGTEGAIFVEDADIELRCGHVFVAIEGQRFCLSIPVFRRLVLRAADLLVAADAAASAALRPFPGAFIPQSKE